jgi:hypothetical protein
VVPGDVDDLILDCYRLADRFHQNPEVFLEMPISRVGLHIHYTVKLTRLQRIAQQSDDDG